MSKGRQAPGRTPEVRTGHSIGTREFERKRRAARVQQTRRREARVRARSTRSIDFGQLLRRVPRAAWVCAAIAVLNAACWSVLTPPFQVPDEPDHFAYVKQVAETGTLPTASTEAYGANVEITDVLDELHWARVRQQSQSRTISTAAGQQRLEAALARLRAESGTRGSTAAGAATPEPPLYYALEAVPYSLASNALTRLQLMRLLSALMAGLTALFVFMFVRETLPSTPWAWSVAGLATSVTPLLGFISGGVNPDAMLYAVSAALFYLLARGFKQGLTKPLAAGIGIALTVGLLTKLNFIGLIPGVCIGVILLAMRARRAVGSVPWRCLGIVFGIPAVPLFLYAIIGAASNHPVLGVISGAINTAHPSLRELSYMWQLFFPRIPGTANYFPGIFTTRQLWFNGYVGLYGWLDTAFPTWVYNFAIVPLGALIALLISEAVRRRRALQSNLGEILAYTAMAVGLMAIVAHAAYATFPGVDAAFAESRYLLPLLPLFAVGIAMAARGAGRRWGPVVGTLIVVLFVAHDVFSQLLVAARYYA